MESCTICPFDIYLAFIHSMNVFEVHVSFAYINSLFLFIVELYFIIWIPHSMFNYSHVQVLAITNKAEINIHVQVFVWK